MVGNDPAEPDMAEFIGMKEVFKILSVPVAVLKTEWSLLCNISLTFVAAFE